MADSSTHQSEILSNMSLITENVTIDRLGIEMYQLMTELYPICRSITGEGFRESLRMIQKHIPIKIHEVPSGTQVFDWVVPKEWNVRDAYIKNENGEISLESQLNFERHRNTETRLRELLAIANASVEGLPASFQQMAQQAGEAIEIIKQRRSTR